MSLGEEASLEDDCRGEENILIGEKKFKKKQMMSRVKRNI